MKRFIIASLLGTCIFCSCSTYQYSSRQTDIDKQNIVMSPTVVDIQVDYDKRIQASSQRCKSRQEALDECRYLAIVNNNIDVVVDPIYKVEYRSRRYQASLTGFAGHYINSRTFYEDVKLLQSLSKEDVEKYLILHKPEVLQYMNAQGNSINIYQGDKNSK